MPIRGRALVTAAVLVAMFALRPPAQAQAPALYKSVGKDGVVIYSDHPPAGAKIEKILTFEYLPRSELPAATASRVEQLRKAPAVAARAAPAAAGGVRLYTAAWCGYCKLAKAYLNGHSVAFDEYDIDTADGLKAYARAGGGRGIPLLLVGEQRIQGFSEKAYDAVLRAR
jgi:glutaredoxin